MDLGSGGGLPGLVLAVGWPGSQWVLLDSNRRRTCHLEQAVADLGLEARVVVMTGRAEDLVGATTRATFQLVVTRSFAKPAVTAECAAPYLVEGGRLVVSEPPAGSPSRWHPEGLACLGMKLEGPLLRVGGGSFQAIVQVSECPAKFPRGTGVAARRPLF